MCRIGEKIRSTFRILVGESVSANTRLKLQVFERKVLRRIYGPTKDNDGTWMIKSNEELNRQIRNKKIINHINPLKTKRRPFYLKTQSVPRCKHFISVIKTNQFML
jgi:hypothetical protein